MNDKAAYEAWFRVEKYNLYDGDYSFAKEAWHAALAWLRSKQEPVAWYITEKHLATTDGQWSKENECEPLFLAPQPAIPDGWLDRGKAALAECRAADDLWSDDRLLSHLFNAMTAAPQPAIPDGWISVDDRLPELWQHVVFVTKASGLFAHLNGRVLCGIYCDSGFSIPGLTADATHWMPAPNPPKDAPEQTK